MQHKTMRRIRPVLILALGIFLGGCSNTLQAPQDGPGLLHIQAASGEGRTLAPDIAFGRYDFTLSAEGQESINGSVAAPGKSFTVELAPVVWTIAVWGFAQAGDSTPRAAGSREVKIKSGSTETIAIPLGPIEGDGAGTFAYDLSLPAGLGSAILTLVSLADSADTVTRDLLAVGSQDTIQGRAAGYYRFNLTLDRDLIPLAGQRVSLSEVVHIYDGAVTGFTLSTEAAAALGWAYAPRPILYFDHGRRIADADAPATQEAWEAQNTYYVPAGQSVVLAPVAGNIPQGAVYEWTVDNAPVHTGAALTHSFTAGSSRVQVAAKVDAVTHATASALVKTVSAYAPRSGGTKAQAAVCVEFSPAPGQFVGVGNGYSNPSISGLGSKSEAEVIGIAQEYMDGIRTFNNEPSDGRLFSLGGWGGYYTVYFDHSVPNKSGADIDIDGNYDVAHMAEPGIVWVSQDLNGDGKPNEIWYRIPGAQTQANPRHAIAYFKPDDAIGKTSALWIDNAGGSGFYGYNANGNDYFPYHLTAGGGRYVMFTGTLLEDNSNLNGYVDAGTINFNLDDAVDAAGQPVSLSHIDFVKVQTGLHKDDGVSGEYSTESGIPVDLHFGQE
jgi:hypothetical protein